MPLNAESVRRFMRATDAALQAVFPGKIQIGAKTYDAAAVGGSALTQYAEGGEVPQGTRVFRVTKAAMPERPDEGTALTWLTTDGDVTKLRVVEVPDRPHETSWHLRCVPLDR